AITGGNVGLGALTGAVTGAIGYGVSRVSDAVVGQFVDSYTEYAESVAIKTAGGALSGGFASVINGGDFGKGALNGMIVPGAMAAGFGLLDLSSVKWWSKADKYSGGVHPGSEENVSAFVDMLQDPQAAEEYLRIQAQGGMDIVLNSNQANGFCQ